MWLVEEKCEDAFQAYLRASVPGELAVYTAWTDEEIKFPCVVCVASESDNENDDAAFNGHRRVNVSVRVVTEATPELDAAGRMIRTSRERNMAARDAVMRALAKTALQDDLNEMNIAGVMFSSAHMTKLSRSVDERRFVSDITVDCIANPTAS
jgi:hypothetical protein